MNMFAFWLTRTGWIGIAILAISILLVLYFKQLRTAREKVQQDIPSFDMPSDDKQMEALIDGSAHQLVLSVLGKKRLDPGGYYAVMTVSFQSVLRFMESNCSVDQIATTTEKRHDEFCTVLASHTI